MNRRDFLRASAASGAAATLAACGSSPTPTGRDRRQATPGGDQIDPQGRGVFAHGVASGDPYADSVLLWTRFTPEADGDVAVNWELAADPEFSMVVDAGSAVTSAARDYTIKVIAGTDGDGSGLALEPDTTYYYRFIAFEATSVIGRTRTAPDASVNPDRLRFAHFSCSMFSLGYFNSYASAALRRDLNAVFFLGDYIYEYGSNADIGVAVNPERTMEPPNEIQTLEDYRIRHANYKSDADLQEIHRQNPAICIWDDHESTNDPWECGAQNHTDGEEGADGTWPTRRRDSFQAYWEWMPVREVFNPTNAEAFGGQQLYRKLSYGALVDIFMLDTRNLGRAEQVGSNAAADAPGRGIMSEAHERWLYENLRDSTAQWKIIGQQTMFSQLYTQPATPVQPAQPFTYDSWDGYNWQRLRVMRFLAGGAISDWRSDAGLSPADDGDPCTDVGFTFPPETWTVQNTDGAPVTNVVVITGDIHTPFGCELTPDPNGADYTAGAAGSVGVEFVCTSVTMVGFPVGSGPALEAANPHMRHTNPGLHGYTLLDIDATRCQGEWWVNPDINVPSDAELIDAVYAAVDGSPYLTDQGTGAVSSGDPDAPPLAP